ncbi:MAG: HEPN domain-containing protein [Anaerolineae bacterium]
MKGTQIEAKRWFRQAQADLEVAYALRRGGYYAAACFHSQQAAEKAMKALFYSQGSRVVLGHSVRELALQGEKLDPSFANVREAGALLDQFYIPTRYPNGLPPPAIPSQSYTASQADMALEAAEQVLEVVGTFLRAHTDILKEEE